MPFTLFNDTLWPPDQPPPSDIQNLVEFIRTADDPQLILAALGDALEQLQYGINLLTLALQSWPMDTAIMVTDPTGAPVGQIDENGVVTANLYPSIIAKASTDSPYTLLSTECTVVCDTTGGNLTIKLPAEPAIGELHYFSKRVAGNTLTIDGNGVNVKGGATTTLTAAWSTLGVQYTGTEWIPISN